MSCHELWGESGSTGRWRKAERRVHTTRKWCPWPRLPLTTSGHERRMTPNLLKTPVFLNHSVTITWLPSSSQRPVCILLPSSLQHKDISSPSLRSPTPGQPLWDLMNCSSTCFYLFIYFCFSVYDSFLLSTQFGRHLLGKVCLDLKSVA